MSVDNEELDIYVLGEHFPHECFTGRIIDVIHRPNDDDDKFRVMQNGKNYTDE